MHTIRPVAEWSAPETDPIVEESILERRSDGRYLLDGELFNGTAIRRALAAPIEAHSFTDGAPDGREPFHMLRHELPEPLIILDEENVENYGGPGMFDPGQETLVDSESFTGIVLQAYRGRVGYLALVFDCWTVEYLGIRERRIDYYIYTDDSVSAYCTMRRKHGGRVDVRRGFSRTILDMGREHGPLCMLTIEGKALDLEPTDRGALTGIDELISLDQLEGVRLDDELSLFGDGIGDAVAEALLKCDADSSLRSVTLGHDAKLSVDALARFALRLGVERIELRSIDERPSAAFSRYANDIKTSLPNCEVLVRGR